VKILTEEDTRSRLEKGGMEWVKKFDWDDAADKFLTILEEVASQR